MKRQNEWMRALLPVALIATTACYTQRPLEAPVPAPATHVIADLTDKGTVAMSDLIGAGAVAIEGIVSSADDATWTLQMVRVDHRDMRTIEWNREPVVFSRQNLTDPRVKMLDKKKSWLVAVGILGGAFVIAHTFDLTGSDADEDGGPVPEFLVIPLRGR